MNWNTSPSWRKEEENKVEENENLILKKNFVKIEHQNLTNLKKIELPKENELIKIITKNRFSPFTFISRILEFNKTIDDLIITTYSFSSQNIIGLKNLIIEGKIKKATIVICKIRKSDQKIHFLLKNLKETGREKVKVIYTDIHCKIISLRTGKDYFTIEGSGNMSTVGKIEQYNIEKNKETFDFHKKWIKNIKEIMTEKEIIFL